MTEDLAPAEVVDRVPELERKLAELEQSAKARLVRAELKVEAIRAGMVDLDGLKLVDLDQVQIGKDGEVEGAAALMRTLRVQKPWLFGAANSSSAATPPQQQPPAAKQAREMSHEEWQSARRDLIKRK